MRWLRRLRGEWRHWWGWCPSCNSDAPERDICPVCRIGYGKPGHTEDGSPVRWIRFVDRDYR